MVAGRLHDDAKLKKAIADGRGLFCRGLQRFAIADELDTEIKPHAVHGADQRKPLLQRFEPRLEVAADDARVVLQFLLFEKIEHRLTDDGTHRTAA